MNDTIKIMIAGTFCIIAIIIVANVTNNMFGHRNRGGVNQAINTVQAVQMSNTNGIPNLAQQQMMQTTQTAQAIRNSRQFIEPSAKPTPEAAQFTQSTTSSQTTPAGTTQTKIESVPGITKTTQTNRVGKICDKKKCIYQTEIVEITCYNMTNSCIQTKIGKGTETELLQ